MYCVGRNGRQLREGNAPDQVLPVMWFTWFFFFFFSRFGHRFGAQVAACMYAIMWQSVVEKWIDAECVACVGGCRWR
jgi:hypothetical protein